MVWRKALKRLACPAIWWPVYDMTKKWVHFIRYSLPK